MRSAMLCHLIRYLQIARKTFREPQIDAELAYSYAKTDGLHDIEELGFTNVADALTPFPKV
jgi:clathrin heavy chain